MFKIGEYVVYKKTVCKLGEIKKKHFNNNDYYILIPVFDNKTKIEIPIETSSKVLRNLITKEDIINIISQINDIKVIESDNRLIENEYKNLINRGKHTDLIKIIKTAYLRNKEKLDNNKKISDKDNKYFHLAEKYLYEEFSVVLGMSYDSTKKYVIDEVSKLQNNE